MDILELKRLKGESEKRIADFINLEKQAFEKATGQVVVGLSLTFIGHYNHNVLDGSLLSDVTLELPPI